MLTIRPNPPDRFDSLLLRAAVPAADEAPYGCDRCSGNSVVGVPMIQGDFAWAHLCCAVPAKRQGWFGGMPCEPPTQHVPADMFDADRIMRRYSLDTVLLVLCVHRGLIVAVPHRLHRSPGHATPYLRVTSPQRIERALTDLRAELAVARITAAAAKG